LENFGEWGLQVVLDYEKKVDEIEEIIRNFPQIGLYMKEYKLYKKLVVPQIYTHSI